MISTIPSQQKTSINNTQGARVRVFVFRARVLGVRNVGWFRVRVRILGSEYRARFTVRVRVRVRV